MGLNDAVNAERVHIGFFGRRNAGKSSVVNAVTGQELSVVSEIPGTTTDPVKKTMELLPIGPVVIIDTAGIDDEGELGEMRVKKARQILDAADIAVLVVDALKGLAEDDRALIKAFEEKNTPYIIAFNKADLLPNVPETKDNIIYVSALDGFNIRELKELIGKVAKSTVKDKPIVSDLLSRDIVVLVVPIDSAAPKGRLILPQQQTIRDLLDGGNIAVVCTDNELVKTLASLSAPPKMVITDSQVFGKVSKAVPDEILLTSFSILFARKKGNLATLVRGAARLDKLRDGDRVLISEGCTHHRQCDDIGTVKLPKWLADYTGKKLTLDFSSGTEFPDEELPGYSLVIHCGGCMLNEKEMQSRLERAESRGVAITNYGIAIAKMHGILARALSPFPDIRKLLTD